MTIRKHDDGEPEAAEGTLSEQDIKQITENLEDGIADLRDMSSRLDPLVQRQLRESAGPHFERMASSQEDASSYLTDTCPQLREAALDMLSHYWNGGDTPPSLLEEMAISDPASGVRDSAIRMLGNAYRRTKDQRIAHFLAAIVLDDDIIEGIRLTAFMSLLRVNGIMDYVGKSPLVPLSLQEIDWPFVRGFLDAPKASED